MTRKVTRHILLQAWFTLSWSDLSLGKSVLHQVLGKDGLFLH